jgi:hypothetical protein
MRYSTSLFALFVLSAASFSCVAQPGEVQQSDKESVATAQQPWAGGWGPLRGHEDILRLAIDSANAVVGAAPDGSKIFPDVVVGDSCSDTVHPMVQGNCKTDSPDARMLSAYTTPAKEWQTGGAVQDLHFLRNRVTESQAQSAREACYSARERIAGATERAVLMWEGDREQALYWAGHATHILSDSFAKPHAVRSGANLETLQDICLYRKKVTGVCYHPIASTKDMIWKNSCLLSTSRDYECMEREAQVASDVTGGYLIMLAKHVTGGSRKGVRDALLDFFESSTGANYKGYFQCDQLPDSRVTLPAKADDPGETIEEPTAIAAEPLKSDAAGCSVSSRRSPAGSALAALLSLAAGIALLRRRPRS